MKGKLIVKFTQEKKNETQKFQKRSTNKGKAPYQLPNSHLKENKVGSLHHTFTEIKSKLIEERGDKVVRDSSG